MTKRVVIIWSVLQSKDKPCLYVTDSTWPDIDWESIDTVYWKEFPDKKEQNNFNRKNKDLKKLRDFIHANKERLGVTSNLMDHWEYQRIIVSGTDN